MMLNETIRHQRKERNWTQEDLATQLGVSASAVHKWETGSSCPDIALLSPLARLLGTDLNTLLSFREDLTEGEISLFLRELRDVMEREGYEAAFLLATEKLREYPASGMLSATTATFLDGALTLFPPADPAGYPAQIEDLYRRAAESDCPSAREQASVMLLFRHADRGEWAQAEELLERLPQTPIFAMDRETVQISLLLRKKDFEAAEERIETSLLRHVTQCNALLPQLLTTLLETGQEEDAAAVTQLAQRLGEVLALPPVVRLSLPLTMALHRKNAEESLSLLEAILEGLQQGASGAFGDSPLFRLLRAKKEAQQGSDAAQDGPQVLSAFLSAFLAGLERDPETAFLRDHPGYAALREAYGA